MATTSPLADGLRNILQERVKPDESLARYTTFRLGGPADYLVEVHSRQELVGVCELAQVSGTPLYILGNGSNLLVTDAGVRGIVIVLAGQFDRWERQGERVTAGGGHNLPRLAVAVSRLGLGGLEFACGIPGSLGAGLMINAGAHGSELKDVVESAVVVWADQGSVATLDLRNLGLGYRTSKLQGTSAIVVEVTMRLVPGDPAVLMEKIKHNLERRRQTQPLSLPNAGSIFTNPPGNFAGRLIEQAGCKGWTEGGAQVSEKHANFFVNLGWATARDVLVLMDRVRAAVEAHSGIRLQPEVKIWGEQEHFR